MYFNTPDFVVPTTLNPAMAKTHRSRHWAKHVSSYPTSLDNQIPTTSLALQGKFHEVPTVSRFVCVGFHWKPLLLLSSALGLWSSNATKQPTTEESSSSLLIGYHSQTDPNACCEAKISRMETKNQCSPSQHHVINHESMFPNMFPINVFCQWVTFDQ